MAENADISGKTFTKTFRDYAMELRAQSDLDAAPVRAPSDARTDERAAAQPVTPPPVADVVASATIDELVSEIEGTADLARKKGLIYRLNEPVRTQVIAEIRLRKERAEQAKTALESQLDDLFKV